MITQSMTKLEGNPMTGLFDRCTDQGARSGPIGKSGPPQMVDQFFRNFSGWTEPIHRVSDRNFRKFWLNGLRPRSSHVFSQCLRLLWCIRAWGNKHARWIQLQVNVTDHKCGIGIWSIFDTVFRYLPIFLTVLRYWIPSNFPLFPRISKPASAVETFHSAETKFILPYLLRYLLDTSLLRWYKRSSCFHCFIQFHFGISVRSSERPLVQKKLYRDGKRI